ncbi:MAG TPA: thiosulfate oxidation carrier protein SoxY [Azospira sp.]|nr:thiosulfate oxidation carrier protein SoxY [Azospira sp.]
MKPLSDKDSMDAIRRHFLKNAAQGSLAVSLLAAGLLRPTRVLAAEWNQPAFSATTLGEALKAYGTSPLPDSREVQIVAADVAENGGNVPVEVICRLPSVQSIALFVEKNPFPLATSIEMAPGVLPYLKLPLKLAESTRIKAVVKAGGKTYVATREVGVTIGGCGG